MGNQNKENTACIVCGKKYHLCIACERNKATWRPWKVIVDSENCYNIYKVVNDYNFSKITKNEARTLLEKLNLTEVHTFREHIRQKIYEIMKKTKKAKPIVIEEPTIDVVERNTTIDVVEEI